MRRKIARGTKINPSEIAGWIARLFALSAFFVANSPMLGASDLIGIRASRRHPRKKSASFSSKIASKLAPTSTHRADFADAVEAQGYATGEARRFDIHGKACFPVVGVGGVAEH